MDNELVFPSILFYIFSKLCLCRFCTLHSDIYPETWLVLTSIFLSYSHIDSIFLLKTGLDYVDFQGHFQKMFQSYDKVLLTEKTRVSADNPPTFPDTDKLYPIIFLPTFLHRRIILDIGNFEHRNDVLNVAWCYIIIFSSSKIQ